MAENRGPESREHQREERGLERQRRGSPLQRRDPFDIFGTGAGPFSLMRRMQEDMDRIFSSFGMGRMPSLMGREQGVEWSPAIEVFQRGDELVVRADLPGLTRDDLTVEVGEDALTIAGERKYDRKEEREGYFRSERGYGTFCRMIPLPEGALTDNAKANFRDGVLEVTIPTPPQEVRRGRRIEIGQESTSGGQARGTQPAGEQKTRPEQNK